MFPGTPQANGHPGHGELKARSADDPPRAKGAPAPTGL